MMLSLPSFLALQITWGPGAMPEGPHFELVQVESSTTGPSYAPRTLLWRGEDGRRRSLSVPRWMRGWRLRLPEAQALFLGRAAFPVFAAARRGDVFEVAASDGLWIVDLAAARTLADVALSRGGESAFVDRFFVDRGTYSISLPGSACDGKTARYGQLLAHCGSYTFLFNGHELRVLDETYEAVARAVYRRQFDVTPRQGEMYRTEIPVRDVNGSVRIGGVVYLN